MICQRSPTRSNSIPASRPPGSTSVAILGAGDLVSHVHRCEGDPSTTEYQFNIFRLADDMRVTHELRACDLRDVIKLCQVLTFPIAIQRDGISGPNPRSMRQINLGSSGTRGRTGGICSCCIDLCNSLSNRCKTHAAHARTMQQGPVGHARTPHRMA